jgi:hypothetical protein
MRMNLNHPQKASVCLWYGLRASLRMDAMAWGDSLLVGTRLPRRNNALSALVHMVVVVVVILVVIQ